MRRRGLIFASIGLLALSCSDGSSQGDDGGESTESSSDGSETDSESSSEEDSTTEWTCEDEFCDDLPSEPECGNGKIEGTEECDGDVDNATCDECSLVCDDDFWDCNDDVSDGCEVDLGGDTLNCGDCGHDCLGATCDSGQCLPVIIVQGEPAPMNVAVDATHVYWTNAQNAGNIARATLDGDDRTELTVATSPFDLAIDDDDVFYTADDEVLRVDKAGGAATTLIGSTGAARGVAIDDTDVFYVDMAANDADGDVERVPKQGGSETVLATAETSPRFFTVMAGDVYWTDDAAKTVSRTKTDASGPVDLLASDQNDAWDITANADIASWTNLADVGELKWLSLADLNDLRTIAISVRPWGITIGEEYVWWTTEDGEVYRTHVDGEQELAEKMADDQMTPHGIANDENFVYWADTAAGTIVRLTK